MQKIEFETPTLNDQGKVLAWTHHTARQFTERLDGDVRLEMLVVPAGVFQMGSPRQFGNPDEQPQHLVGIKSFMMSKFLITQEQWKAILGKLPPCRFKGDHLPVERVSWKDAQSFGQRLSKKTGRNYQLPSESQWEYACRAGTSSAFSFGETVTINVANFNGEPTFLNEPRGFYRHVTTEGGAFPPNAFGLYDMHGNLWEWCADNWLDDSAPLQEIAVRIRIKTAAFEWHAVDRGTSRLIFVAVQRAFECCNQMQRSLLDFDWFVTLLKRISGLIA